MTQWQLSLVCQTVNIPRGAIGEKDSLVEQISQVLQRQFYEQINLILQLQLEQINQIFELKVEQKIQIFEL